jgi:ankyrin repeat protein
MIDAAKTNNITELQRLVATGANINSTDANGKTALMWAAENGHLETAQCLLIARASINTARADGMTALMWAAMKGRVAVAEFLVRAGAMIDAARPDGKTALILAKSEGHNAMAKLLVELDKDLKKSDKSPLTYKSIQEQFSLYGERPGDGKKPCTYGVYHAGGENYEKCIVGRIENISKRDRSDIGFLVSIPVPYLERYTRGSDRDPITLIRKYIKAICTLDPEYSQDNYTDEAGLEFARKRLRIIIGLNVKDDHFNLDQKTRNLHEEIHQFSNKINAHLKDKRWPAWVVPTLWGIEHDLGPEFYFDSSKVDWENSRSDCLRQHLAQVKVPGNHVKMKFPFASMRSFLIESTACKIMLQELSALNKKVYFLTGDADLISLKPINKNISVFNLVCDTVIAHPDTYFMRLGGAYGFENEEVAQQIMSKFTILPELYLARSVLMTQLLRSLDTATRRIMSQIDQALAYYSEAHTYTVAEVFDQDGKHFVWAGNKKSSPDTKNSPITKSARNSKHNEPDFTTHIAKAIIQEKHWVSNPKNREQKFLAERSTQLLTSSRHDLAVIKPSTMSLPREGAAGIQVIDEGLMSTAVLKEMIGKQHNTQLTSSQLNSRFREAGYGDKGFHESVALLPIIRMPFVVYFLTKETVIKGIENQTERIDAAQKEMGIHPITSAGIPDDTTFQAIYKKLMDISERPESLLVNDPVIDIPGMRNIGTQRLNTHRQLILKAFFQLEHLLRWSVAMMHRIKSLTESYELKIKNKTVAGDDLLSGDIFKRNGQVGAPPAARTLDYFSANGAVDGMQKSSQDTKQAVSSNDLSVEEALVGPMQKFLLAEEEMIKESLFFATQKGISGPNKIPGWTIQDVPDVGNCFYEAIIHQMQTINHPFLFDVPVGGVPHLYLRNILNSSNEGEWAEDRTIDEFVTKVSVILAIVDTRRPDDGYVCYYLGADETVTTNPDIDLFLPTDKPIIRIAATGNHFLSVVQNPELNAGRLRSGYMAPVLLPGYSPSFFTRLSTKSIIDQRHENSFNQRAYDNLFGLVPWIN